MQYHSTLETIAPFACRIFTCTPKSRITDKDSKNNQTEGKTYKPIRASSKITIRTLGLPSTTKLFLTKIYINDIATGNKK